jgi:FtsP/CotA-like multicopper oxidase with cupredoxin domain
VTYPSTGLHGWASTGPARSRYSSQSAADSLLLAAGARFDVLVRGGPPGTAPAGAAVRTGQAGNQFPQATPATLVSEGPPTRPVGLPTTFAPPEDLSRATVAARRTIVFSENDAADKFSINGKQFDPNRVDIQSKLNNRFPAAARAARCGRSPLRCPVNAGHDQAGGQR